MRLFTAFFLVSAASVLGLPAQAQQAVVNVRGVITAFDGKAIQIKANDGRAVEVALPEGVNVAATKAFSLADIKPGMMLGVTTVVRDDKVVAIDVHPIPPVVKPGLSPYDLQPQSTMTNAVLEASAKAANGDELTLDYKTGTVKVLVPPGTPMSQSVPGSREDLKAGETIYVAARDEGGKLTAVRVQVSKDGVKPTQ
ncbi:hypothetical protein PY365_23195 [Roseiarcaceae bacterium H3SJ34-1]|uniref:hypothetical protein n=1 Tax=Terripilifer ovatus TaxID=3032367 RepID=UPI003AB92894|nr:hypothetical protein [Roseiarcaceae bacterium H3SJ34-1]